MGAASSRPQQPPLIALNGGNFGKHNNILVPAEAFTGKWFPKTKAKGRPNYQPVHQEQVMYCAAPKMGRRGGRGQGRRVRFEQRTGQRDMRPKRKHADRMRGMARGGMKGGIRGRPGMPATAYYPSAQGFVPMGPVMYHPQETKAQGTPHVPVGFMPLPRGDSKRNTGLGGGPGAQPGLVPGYTLSPGMAGMMYPQGGAPPYTAPVQPRIPTRVTTQQAMHPPPGVEAVAQGAHHAQPPSPSPAPRRKPEPSVSANLNRTQPTDKRAGPSGQEWISSADAFLDACICTTNCHCRKGARVLYRHQGQGDGENNTWGEIRYILKDELGKDCGDHSRCRDDDTSEEGHWETKKKKGGKGKGKGKTSTPDFSDVEKMRKEIKGLREDIKNMRVRGDDFGMVPDMATGAAANVRRVAPQEGWPGVMGGTMYPRMPQHMTAGVGDPFGMGFPPYMQQPMEGGGKTSRFPGRMPGRMPGMSIGGMDPAEDMRFPSDPEAAMNRLYTTKHPRNPGGPRRPKHRRGPPGRPPHQAPNLDPYVEYSSPRIGRRANMNGPGQGSGDGVPFSPPDYGFEDDSGVGSGPGGAPGRFEAMDDMDDDEGDRGPRNGRSGMVSSDWEERYADGYASGMLHDMDVHPPPPPPPPPRQFRHSLRGRGRGSGSGEARPSGAEGRRLHQAYVDDGDDYIY